MAKESASVRELVEEFVQRLTATLQQETEVRAREAFVSVFGGATATPKLRSKPGPKPGQKKTSNPRLKLAGRYMGLIKGVKKSDQKQVKDVRAAKGIEAAIELMTQMQAART